MVTPHYNILDPPLSVYVIYLIGVLIVMCITIKTVD